MKYFLVYFKIILLSAPLFVATCKKASTEKASGTIIMTFDLSHYDKNAEVKLWIPYPVSNEYQTIGSVKIDGDYKESSINKESKFGNTLLFARWDKGATSRKLQFSFKAVRKEVSKKKLAPEKAVSVPKEYKIYLSSTKYGPIDEEVKGLADTITRDKKTILERARAVYDWTCVNTFRDPNTRGCGLGDVKSLLKRPGGKCADISSIFVTLARAAGVPAREIFGIRMGKKPDQDITKWQHCWAEFYLPGYGWVPVDPGDVRKMILVHNLKFNDKKTGDYIKYFWGGIDQYRIGLTKGKDLELNPLQQGGPVNYLMYPFAQVNGKTVDWLDPENFKYKITYKM